LVIDRSDREKEVNLIRYKEAEKVAKKVVTLANSNEYERLH